MAAVISVVILEPKKMVCHCFCCFPVYLPWSEGTRYHDLHFLNVEFYFILFFYICLFFSFIFIIWMFINLQYCSGFAIHWRESAMDLHVFRIPIPFPSLRVITVQQPWVLVSCIQPRLVICFTIDSVVVSVLFSQNIPQSLKVCSVHLCLFFCFAYMVIVTIILKSIYMR